MRLFPLGSLALSALILAGCHSNAIDYSDLELIPVKGSVTLDGKPLVGARVRFIGEDGSGSDGVTDAEGNYSLHYDSSKLGATPGKKKVTVTTASAAAVDDPDGASDAERIPARYNSATELRVEVGSAVSTYNFDLTS